MWSSPGVVRYPRGPPVGFGVGVGDDVGVGVAEGVGVGEVVGVAVGLGVGKASLLLKVRLSNRAAPGELIELDEPAPNSTKIDAMLKPREIERSVVHRNPVELVSKKIWSVPGS